MGEGAGDKFSGARRRILAGLLAYYCREEAGGHASADVHTWDEQLPPLSPPRQP